MRHLAVFVLSIVATTLVAGCANTKEGERLTAPAAGAATLRTLVDNQTGLDVTSGGTGTFNWAGQSFVVQDSGAFGDLRFHWYSFQRAPVAFGSLYLLTQEYLGVPGNLGSTTAGFVARSERIENGVYVFGAGATITGGTKYWVYTDTQGSFAGSFDTDIYPSGDLYVTGFPTSPFRRAQASGRMVNGVFVPAPAGVFIDANFKLQAKAR